MSDDISQILREWPLDEGVNVRRIQGSDGRERIQIRVCIDTYHGLLQFDCDGRPDGLMPRGREHLLDYYEDILGDSAGEDGDSLALTHEEADELFEESKMMYHRYIVLLQLGDYSRVVRDTDHNMRIFRLVNACAVEPEDRDYLEKWWPYILRIHYTARCMLALQDGDSVDALDAVEEAIKTIEDLSDREDEIFKSERDRSLVALRELETAIAKQGPTDELRVLKRLLDDAVEREEYDKAAVIRDRIRALESKIISQ